MMSCGESNEKYKSVCRHNSIHVALNVKVAYVITFSSDEILPFCSTNKLLSPWAQRTHKLIWLVAFAMV